MISILFLSADPTDASRLRLGEEAREIQEKLQLAKLRDEFSLHQRTSIRPADMSQALLDINPQVVHFSGHGTVAGAICLESQTGQIHPVEPETLAALFEQFTNNVNCVVLNACYSAAQAEAISKHIQYVIGMNKAIDDKAAIAFSVGFYQALGAGRSIEESYKLGCVQIRLANLPEHLTPVLIKNQYLEHVSLRQDHNQPETVKVVTQRLLKYPGGFSWQISITNSQSQGQVSIHHIGVVTVSRHYYVLYSRVSPRVLSKVVVSRLKDLARSYDGRLISGEAAHSVDVIGDATYLLDPGEIETLRIPFILDSGSEMLVCLGLVVDYTTHEGERRTAISDCILAADAREMSVAKYELASLRMRRTDADNYAFERDVVIECSDGIRELYLYGRKADWGTIFDECISFLDGSSKDFHRVEPDGPKDPSPPKIRAQQLHRVNQRVKTIATSYLIPENLTESEALQGALSTAVAVGGRVANLVEIMQIPGAIFDGKQPYLPVSEEIVAHDRYGKFADENGIVFLTIHGLGVLTPGVLARAKRIGYIGNNSANLATIFAGEDVVSTILNEGFLPDGRYIEVVAFDDYRTNGIHDCSKVHCVVRRIDQAVYPDFNNMDDLADNPQVIAYCGGKERAQVLLARLRERKIGRLHTRNILFFPNKYFRDKAYTELIAPVANPLYGPCDGLYGGWPLSERDSVFGRYLVLREEPL